MRPIEENISLKPFNTFGLDVNARFFIRITNKEEVRKIYSEKIVSGERKLIIGGGSNILLLADFDGIVIKNEIKGIEITREDNDFVWVSAGAGENWHEFVLYCIDKNWAGIENLSLIPGCVGAAPMQNIGAYGVEVKDVIDSVYTLQLDSLEECIFSNQECKFGYRESIFKNEEKGKYFITRVIFKLSKKPDFKIKYGAIEEELKKEPEIPISIRKISNAVIRIRESKLPNPKEIGNAGSFFKNPEISKSLAEKLKEQYPNLVYYPVNDNIVKVAAGWLIENAGWKGYKKGDFGVHKNQALVLVNYGNATGKEIVELSNQIIDSIQKKFGIQLEREVNLV